MERYIIAVRREVRDQVPPDWFEKLRQIEDLTILGATNSMRVQVQASERAIERARQILGDDCYIEPAIYHQTSRESPGSGETTRAPEPPRWW